VAFCPGVEDIVVRVQNFGINIIDSVQVDWTLNGVPQPGQMVSTTLDTIGGIGQSFINITLGSHNFVANTTTNIVAWTSLPNNQVDTVNFNDTLSVSLTPAISGTYTINSATATGGTNFQSFNDLSSFLDVNGICGPVVVNVVPNSGPYNEEVEFGEVVGASSVNTITVNGNGNTLQYTAAGTNDRTTLTMNGADWFTFDSLEIKANGTTHGWVLLLTQGADHNTFKNCLFETSTSSTSTFFSSVVMSNSPTSAVTLGNTGNYNLFENNHHIGGYYSFTLNGSSTTVRNVGNVIRNSVMEDYALYGIYARAQDSLIIENNDISRENRTDNSTTYGLFFTTGISNARIMGNRVHDVATSVTSSTAASYPIYMSGADAPNAASYNVLANNLIYNINNGGIIYAVYLLGALNNHWRILHNTVVVDDPSSTSSSATRMVFVSGAQNNMEIKNNIFYLDRGNTPPKHMVYFTSAANTVDVNNNNYHVPAGTSNFDFGFNGANISTFAAWQTAGFDVNGIEFDPLFIGGTGNDFLRPSAAAIKFLGQNVLTDVPTDIDGDPRTPAPDPGAYQFEPPVGADIGIVRFIEPSAGCPGSADVIVEIGSFATDTIDTVYMSWTVNNVPQTAIMVVDSFYPGNLVAVNMGSFIVAGGVVYDIEVTVDSIVPGPDIDLSNNSIELLDFRAGLSGTFTIDQFSTPSATNFTSFTDLANVLNAYGVCGPVTVNVQNGPYNEQFELGSIEGTSASNRITINGNGNTLSYSAQGSGDRNTVTFNGTSYVTVDSLNIEANGASFGWVLFMTNQASHNVFSSCSFTTEDNSTSLNFSNVVMSGSPTSGTLGGDVGNHNTFINNFHKGGYYGITISGQSSAQRNVGNKVINSVFEDFYLYGSYFRSQDSLVVDGNTFNRADRTTLSTFYGIFLTQGHSANVITNNRIHDNNTQNTTTTNAAYPIYLSSATATAAQPSIMANNLVYNINNGGVIYALYFIGALNNHWKVYHNTVVVDQPNATSASATRLWFCSGAQSDVEVKNNIFYLDRSSAPGFFNYNTSAGANIDFDNNVYFSPTMNNVTFGFQGGNVNTFSDWQTAGFDVNGAEADPGFLGVGADFYRPTVGAVKALGANVLADVPTDIEGVARTATPDPGVYQFDPLPCTGVFNEDVDSLYPGGSFISWESFGNVNEWEIEWDVCGFTPGSLLGNIITNVTNNQGFHLDSLPMGQCVCVYIREACPQGGFGPWNDPIEICVPIEFDAELVSLVSPEDGACGDSLMDVRVEIRNNGFFPITSLPIQMDITGDINQSFTFTYTGNLLENEVDTVSLGTINSYWGGYINVNAYVSLANDQLLSNDSLSFDSLAILPFQPRVEDVAFCAGETSVTIEALPLPNIIYNWFDVPTGGSPIGVGNSFTVPTAGQPTYYVAYNDISDSLESTATGNVQTANGGNMFDLDIFNALTLTGFSVVGASSGLTDINVYYKVGSLQGHENTPASWTFVETVTNVNLQGTANFVKFNLSNPIALSANQVYGIYLQPITGNFSYASGNPLGSSLGSNADLEILTGVTKSGLFGGNLSPRSWKGRVHYGSEGCSDLRTEVPIVPNTDTVKANFTFNQISHTVEFFNTSQNADSILWLIEGTTYTTDTVVHQFAQTDSFDVCLIAYGLCDTDTVCQTVWAENISVQTHTLAGSLKLYPNPSQGQFELSFHQPYSSDISLELLDLSGKSIWMEHLEAFSGPY
ncbi:MAG: hypothetical protein LAT54_08960, partial [Cryomorphaceae bacterium]|nr:hypothetical protein [Cryomorphaceae bacterium]